MSINSIHELIQKLPEVDLTKRKAIREEILSLTSELETPQAIVEYLSNNNYLIREVVADALGNIDHETCVQQLTSLLAVEQNKQVQMAAVYSLRRIKSFKALETLLNIVQSEKHTKLVQSLAIQSVGVSVLNLVVTPILQVLEKAVSTDNSDVIEGVFEAFKTMDEDERGIPNQLLELLRNKDTPDFLLLYIIDYLGERRVAQAFDDILAYLDYDDTDLQRAAARALGNLGIQRAIVSLQDKLNHEDELVRHSVEQALSRLGE